MALAPVAGDSKRATNFECEIVHCVVCRYINTKVGRRLRVKVLSGYMRCQHQSVAPLEKNKNYQRPCGEVSECERVDGWQQLLWYFSPPTLFMFQGVGRFCSRAMIFYHIRRHGVAGLEILF
jgi:hypothetical protein